VILLDTDHLTVLRFRSNPRAARLVDRLAAAAEPPVATTVVNVEEAMRGWLAAIAKERQARRQVPAYRELADLFAFFAGFHIALFDEAAADRFDALKAIPVRIGTMDLKVAAVALSTGAKLLTANRRDFEQVPSLRFENWLD
jgi:tRNA(fMet)-specific endonuclease VapC